MISIYTTVGKNPLEEMNSHQSEQKIPKYRTWIQSQNDRMISVHFQGKPFIIMVIQVYTLTSNAEKAEVEWFYEDLQDFPEITPKNMFFSL